MIAPPPQRPSRPEDSTSKPLNSSHPPSHLSLEDPWSNFSHYDPHFFASLAPPLACISPAVPLSQSFDTPLPAPDLWPAPDLSLADADWHFLSMQSSPYVAAFDGADVPAVDPAYGTTPAFHSLSDSGSIEHQNVPFSSVVPSSTNSQDGRSHASPASQIPPSTSVSFPSPPTSQGDEALGRMEPSRVEKRRLNTLAARRCRQRRVDRMQKLEDELEEIRRERDELRLRVSKLEGETDALKGLLSQKK
ncbi:hypothetical protein NUU61_004291 [Penicillium alfredii]|uniref:BZIP domain-containing protein n=1 Tax=Penicillium alfredii TaxID=1506179 RepID=A0A9W9FKU2_9EURO|nr:uncharacterized protein NUU61_004291 [Penicillium alfredii]KAJ5102069.1 hypothetical protein NUU61_004291 [Penicillium alfredii]